MQENPFNRERFNRIFALAAPIMLGMGSQIILNLVDTAMVGHISEDPTPLAAVGIAGMALWVATAAMQGISPAVQTITARRLGERDMSQVNVPIVNAFFLIILLGLPYTFVLFKWAPAIFERLSNDAGVREMGLSYFSIRLFAMMLVGVNFSFRGYFNGLHKSTLYMQTLLIMHPINVFLNWVLIFGNLGAPAMGSDGAALATAISTGLGTLNYIRLLYKHHEGPMRFSPFALELRTITRLMKLSVPSCVQGIAMSAGFLAFFRIADMIGKDALAATNILINLALMCILLSMGLGLATISLVSKSLGEGDPDEAVRWTRSTIALATTGMVVLGLVLAVAPGFWLSLFTPTTDVVETAKIPLILFGISQTYDAASIIMMHAHLGGGANRTVAVIAITCQWVLFLPACFIGVKYYGGGLLYIWVCMAVYRLIQWFLFWISSRRGTWLRVAV